jgi:hypothetical protein
MPGNIFWSKGFYSEYAVLENQWNDACQKQDTRLSDFVENIRTKGEGLMDAHAHAFYGTKLPGELKRVHNNWFGATPMWYRDCTVSPGQIHQIMRESRARTAELLLAGGQRVEFWLQCGHPRFRTVITWDGATEEDAEPTDGQTWSPRAGEVTGCVQVWVYTPFNSAYGDVAWLRTDANRSREKEARDTLSHHTAPSAPHVLLPEDDFFKLVNDLPAGETIFQGTALAVAGDEDIYPDPADLEFRPLVGFPTPPPDPDPEDEYYKPYKGQMLLLPGVPRLDPGERNGIEITWQGAGEGEMLIHEDDKQAAKEQAVAAS